jgi:hypothetical protein
MQWGFGGMHFEKFLFTHFLLSKIIIFRKNIKIGKLKATLRNYHLIN